MNNQSYQIEVKAIAVIEERLNNILEKIRFSNNQLQNVLQHSAKQDEDIIELRFRVEHIIKTLKDLEKKSVKGQEDSALHRSNSRSDIESVLKLLNPIEFKSKVAYYGVITISTGIVGAVGFLLSQGFSLIIGGGK